MAVTTPLAHPKAEFGLDAKAPRPAPLLWAAGLASAAAVHGLLMVARLLGWWADRR